MQSSIKNNYKFNETDNIVKLIWNNSINNCGYMFYELSCITEIDLSNFDTSKVINMQSMFYGCSSLSSLNLYNFDTSNVTNMESMFRDCSSLSSLNLSNFDTSKVKDMSYMFQFCTNLKYINLKNFIELDYLKVTNIFYYVPDNIVVCLNENNHSALS